MLSVTVGGLLLGAAVIGVRVPAALAAARVRGGPCTPRAAIRAPFHTAGNEIMMADNRPLRICGATLAGLSGPASGWPRQLIAKERAVARLIGRWHVNTVRIMVRVRLARQPGYLPLLGHLMSWAEQRKHLAVIMQAFAWPCHTAAGLCTPDARAPGEDAVRFWRAAVRTPGIAASATLLDLWNEPAYTGLRSPWAAWQHGRGTGTDAVAGFQQLANLTAGLRDVVIVDGPVVSATLARVMPGGHVITAPPGSGGIAYAIHHPLNSWRAASPAALRKILYADFGRTALHYPVMVSEWSGFSSVQRGRRRGAAHGSGTCWPHAGKHPLYQAFLRYLRRRRIGLVTYGTQQWLNRLVSARSGRLTKIRPGFRCVAGGMHPQEGTGVLVRRFLDGQPISRDQGLARS